MDRQKFIDHRGTRILFSDLSRIDSTEELQQAVRLGTELAQAQPPRSLLVLVDVTDTEYNVASFAVVQQSVAVNRPYIRAHAVVGLPKIVSLPFDIAAKLSQGPMARFDDLETAKDWLVLQRDA